MGEEPFDSTLPWTWVVEALAKSQLVDTGFLYELVSKASLLCGDLGEQAREAVALRCLEGLASEQSNYRISPTESCEAALLWISKETSGSKDAIDELKWDVQSFVKHKKAHLPRSTLEKLDNLILEGTHPLAASLKEISGPAVQDHCVLNIPFDGGDPTSPPLRSDEDEHVHKIMLAENIGCSPRSGLDNQQIEAFSPNGDALPSRGAISSHHIDNHVQEIDAASHGMDNQRPPGKKRKLEKDRNMQPMQQHSVLVSNQMCNGLKDRQCHEIIKPNVTPDGKDVNGLDKEHVENHEKQKVSSNDVHNFREEIDLTLKNRIRDENIYQDVDELDKEYVKNKDVDEPDKEYVKNQDDQNVIPNNGNNCCEEIDFALKNPTFSSWFAFTGDPFAMTETEENRCMKCKKNGQLLSCSSSSCPLLFHENCLGFSPHIDDEGNLLCPFCACSHAISEYDKAKQKVSIARKELSLFIGGRADDQPENNDNTSSGNDINQNVNRNKHGIGNRTAEAKNGANVRRKDGDKTADVKKGANVVAQIAESHQKSLKGKQVEFLNSSVHMDVSGLAMATQQLFSFKNSSEIIIKLSKDSCRVGNHGQDDGTKIFGDNELQNNREITRCKITELFGEASSESISASDEPLQEKRDNDTHMLASPTPIRVVPMNSPQGRGRRKKVPWTVEEETTLKKGVELFVQQGQPIPWKNILDFGRDVFMKGRTTIDLKDKWRNMNLMRGTSPKVK